MKVESSNSWFLGALFLVFLVLKLTNVISLSWWWVTAPLWVGIAIVFSIFLIILIPFIISLFGAIVVEIFVAIGMFLCKLFRR